MDNHSTSPFPHIHELFTVKDFYDHLRIDVKRLDEREKILDKRATELQDQSDTLDKKMGEIDHATEQLLLREEAVAEREKKAGENDMAIQHLKARYSDASAQLERLKKETGTNQQDQATLVQLGEGEDSGEDADVDTVDEDSIYWTPTQGITHDDSGNGGEIFTAEEVKIRRSTVDEHRAKLVEMETLNNALSKMDKGAWGEVIENDGSYPSASHGGRAPRPFLLARKDSSESAGSITPSSVKGDSTVSNKQHSSGQFGNIEIGFSPPTLPGTSSSTAKVSPLPTMGSRIKLLKRSATEEELQGRALARGEEAKKAPLEESDQVRQDVKEDANVYRRTPSLANLPNHAMFSTAYISSSSPSLKVITGSGSRTTSNASSVKEDIKSSCMDTPKQSSSRPRIAVTVDETGSPLHHKALDKLPDGPHKTSCDVTIDTDSNKDPEKQKGEGVGEETDISKKGGMSDTGISPLEDSSSTTQGQVTCRSDQHLLLDCSLSKLTFEDQNILRYGFLGCGGNLFRLHEVNQRHLTLRRSTCADYYNALSPEVRSSIESTSSMTAEHGTSTNEAGPALQAPATHKPNLSEENEPEVGEDTGTSANGSIN